MKASGYSGAPQGPERIDVLMARREALRRQLKELSLDGILTFHSVNRRYLSGFTGTAGYLLITPSEALFLTDSRYTEQAKEQCPGFRVIQHGDNFWADLQDQVKNLRIQRLGFEKHHVTVGWLEEAQRRVPEVQWIGTENLVEGLRMIKDEGEIEGIRRAQQLTDELFARLLAELRPGLRERDVASRLQIMAIEAGAQGMAFDTIVASGWRSALPHGVAGDKVIEAGDFVTIDFGCRLDGYVSDMTRTVVMGKATHRQREIYQLVLRAQEAGLKAIAAGRTGREVDAAARAVIEEAGYGENFGHGLGHGVGMEIHEAPRLSRLGRDRLQSGMVVTVEPGIYLPGWGGVRIEDLVVVRENGHENLTATPKELLEIG